MSSNSTIHAFIFDMDGTMVDNMAYHGEAWAEMEQGRVHAATPAVVV